MVSCWASVNLKKIKRTERDDDVVVVVIVVSDYRPWDDCRPPPPRGIFGHYDFLIPQCLSNKMRHVGPLRSEALSCITYVTPKMLKNRLVPMLQYS